MYTVHAADDSVLAVFTDPLYGPLDANRTMRKHPRATHWCGPDGKRGGRKISAGVAQPIQWDRAPMGTYLPTGWGA